MPVTLKFTCEVCGAEFVGTSKEAYEAGWDIPPIITPFRVLGPRTCVCCLMDKTLWHKIVFTKAEDFSDAEFDTLRRILGEPATLCPPRLDVFPSRAKLMGADVWTLTDICSVLDTKRTDIVDGFVDTALAGQSIHYDPRTHECLFTTEQVLQIWEEAARVAFENPEVLYWPFRAGGTGMEAARSDGTRGTHEH